MPCDAPEPLSITAGDTLSWSRSLALYLPSAGWSLHYLAGAPGAAPIAFDAAPSADGQSFVVSVDAATTAAWTPGRYVVAVVVTLGSPVAARQTVHRFAWTIFANPLTTLGQTHAQTTLGLIEAALEGRIPRGLEDTTIDGQQLTRIPIQDLHALRRKYQAEVKAEQRAAHAAAGIRPRGNLRGVRFVKPGAALARGPYSFPLDFC